jgi:hypothetical protein
MCVGSVFRIFMWFVLNTRVILYQVVVNVYYVIHMINSTMYNTHDMVPSCKHKEINCNHT